MNRKKRKQCKQYSNAKLCNNASCYLTKRVKEIGSLYSTLWKLSKSEEKINVIPENARLSMTSPRQMEMGDRCEGKREVIMCIKISMFVYIGPEKRH